MLMTSHPGPAITIPIFTVTIGPGGLFLLFIWNVVILLCPTYLPLILSWKPALIFWGWSIFILEELFVWDAPLPTIVVQSWYLRTIPVPPEFVTCLESFFYSSGLLSTNHCSPQHCCWLEYWSTFLHVHFWPLLVACFWIAGSSTSTITKHSRSLEPRIFPLLLKQ